MKRTILVILSLLLAVSLAYARDYEMTKKAGDYTVQILIDKNPPVTGNNNLVVKIKDRASKNVTDAAVAIDYGMPAMPGMPAMKYKTNAVLQGAAYHAVVNFSMAGPWTTAIKITKAGKIQTVKLNVDVK